MIFPDKPSPLAHLGGGGVSGRVAQPFTWKLVKDLVALSETPVIGPSVWRYQDIAELRLLGAKAISFGSLFMSRPWRPTLFVRREMESRKTG
jgi:dihydroorotate dehydrogenase